MAEEENKWKARGDGDGDGDGDGEDEDEELDETAFKSAKDALLFAIEVSHSMLTAPPPTETKKAEADSPTSAALKCAYSLMQQRIISSPSDMMGILLYGTEQTKFQGEEQARGGLAYPHCYLLTDLDIPAASDVKALKSLVDDDEEFQKLLVPSRGPVSMANVLFCANQIFTTRAPNFASRRLFIVTDNDDPHEKDKALRAAAAVRAKDLYDLGVIIELFPISKLDHEFERDRFYDDIIYNSSPADIEAPASTLWPIKASSTVDGVSLLNSLLSSINSRAAPRRALFANLPLEIGPGFKISVKGYIIFKRQEPRRSCYVWLNGEVAQIAKGVTTQMSDDTARTVEKGEIKKAYKFGGEQIAFTPEEVISLRYFGDPGIRIIGFKPLAMLPIWANLRPSTFIYPSEEGFVGSTRVFAALQQKLLNDEKMGLAWFVPRKNATPVIAAVVPGAEKLGEHGEQVIPPGMWIIPLPFADDIRQNPETSLIRAPESLVDLMRNVIEHLRLPKAQYNPERYPNPSLQWHYRILQAMALDEDIPEQPDDKTVPKYKQIHKRAGAYIVDWGIELEQQYQAWVKENRGAVTGAKRAAPGDDGSVLKKPKTSNAGTVDDNEMKAHFDKNNISKLTVAVMRGWMDRKNLNSSGKKAELVERIEGFFERK